MSGKLVRVLVGSQQAADAWMRHHGIRPGGPAAPIVLSKIDDVQVRMAGRDRSNLSVVKLHDADPQVETALSHFVNAGAH